MKRKFLEMANIIPVGSSGKYTFENCYDDDGTLLVHNCNITIMHDGKMMRETHREFLDKAHGDIFIGGLGIGLIIAPLLDDEFVDSITVVEFDNEIINYVKPCLKRLDVFHKLLIINDCVENVPTLGRLFDTIYLDLSQIGSYNNHDHNEKFKYLQKRLTDSYRKFLKPSSDAWASCWGYDN